MRREESLATKQRFIASPERRNPAETRVDMPAKIIMESDGGFFGNNLTLEMVLVF